MKAIILISLFILSLNNRFVNRKIIEQLKKVAPYEVYELEDNQFRDWTDEEIKAVFNENKYKQFTANLREEKVKIKTAEPNIKADDSYDFRKEYPDCVHPVRNQDKCGAAIMFAAAVGLEQGYCKKSSGKMNMQLSVQQMLSCDADLGGCTSKNDIRETRAYVGNIGLVEESCFPFTSGRGDIEDCITKCKDGKAWETHDTLSWTINASPKDLKVFIPRDGPYWNTHALYEDFLNYKGGIYQHITGDKIGTHAGVIIGFGNEGSVDFWIVQNSFGDSWGESGYYRINADGADIANSASFGSPRVKN